MPGREDIPVDAVLRVTPYPDERTDEDAVVRGAAVDVAVPVRVVVPYEGVRVVEVVVVVRVVVP